MKYAFVILCFLAMFSQGSAQAGRTVWTKGGHTSAVKNLYFDDNEVLLSAGQIDISGIGDNYPLFGNEAFAYGWNFKKSDIVESYYGIEPYFIPWNNYSQTYTKVKSQNVGFSNNYIAGLFKISTVYAESHSWSINDTANIIIISRENNQRIDAFSFADTNTCISLHPFKSEIAYSSLKNGVILRDFTTKKAILTLPVYNPLALEYSPNGNSLAIATRDSGITLWNLETDLVRFRYPHNKPIYALKFFKDNQYLIAVDIPVRTSFIITQ